MKIDYLKIKSFKNLKDFYIDLNEERMNTVLIGQNATGKSNFIEAIILIFKYLDQTDIKIPKTKDYFDYELSYLCRGRKINVILANKKYIFKIDEEPISKGKFQSNKEYLPKYIFAYYSGQSDRMDKLFWEHQKRFYEKIIKEDFEKYNIDDLRRLFYVKQIHSYFVLLAFYAFPNEENNSRDFLKRLFNIIDIESILFVLKNPKNLRGGDEKFFGARGLVSHFLNAMWDYILAPIYYVENVPIDFRKSEDRERLYLYISDKSKLTSFVDHYFDSLNSSSSNTNLFKALESTYISDLLEETRIKVKKEIDGEVTFKELSEGEQQLLTVLGLLKFTSDDESLVLLDEPDTHLNPLWKWEYLDLLKKAVKNDKEQDSTQIIISTHDPLVIGGLENDEVKIFSKDKLGKITAESPSIDPKGLGVAGILTSELFGLPTILDKETQTDLNRKRYLQGKVIRNDFTKEEYEEYQRLKIKLEKVGFYEEVEDQWFKMYLAEMSKNELVQKTTFTPEEKQELEKISAEAVLRVKALIEKEQLL